MFGGSELEDYSSTASTNPAVEGEVPPPPAAVGTGKPASPPVKCWTWNSENRFLQSEQCSSPGNDARMHRDKTTVLDAGIGITNRPSCLQDDEKQQPARLEDPDWISTSARSDSEALRGPQGRRETCVVNAAMMATSWPYKVVHGNKYNKPIVVDIDLPTWETFE